jgi:23S rRNA pseudouridine2457 synthase
MSVTDQLNAITANEGKLDKCKMTAAVGFPTLRLVRVRVGNVFKRFESWRSVKVSNFDASK